MIPLHFRATATDTTPSQSTAQKTDFQSSLLFQSNPALPRRQVVKSRMAAGSGKRGQEEAGIPPEKLGSHCEATTTIPVNEVASTVFIEKSRFENGSGGEDSVNPGLHSDSPKLSGKLKIEVQKSAEEQETQEFFNQDITTLTLQMKPSSSQFQNIPPINQDKGLEKQDKTIKNTQKQKKGGDKDTIKSQCSGLDTVNSLNHEHKIQQKSSLKSTMDIERVGSFKVGTAKKVIGGPQGQHSTIQVQTNIPFFEFERKMRNSAIHRHANAALQKINYLQKMGFTTATITNFYGNEDNSLKKKKRSKASTAQGWYTGSAEQGIERDLQYWNTPQIPSDSNQILFGVINQNAVNQRKQSNGMVFSSVSDYESIDDGARNSSQLNYSYYNKKQLVDRSSLKTSSSYKGHRRSKQMASKASLEANKTNHIISFQRLQSQEPQNQKLDQAGFRTQICQKSARIKDMNFEIGGDKIDGNESNQFSVHIQANRSKKDGLRYSPPDNALSSYYQHQTTKTNGTSMGTRSFRNKNVQDDLIILGKGQKEKIKKGLGISGRMSKTRQADGKSSSNHRDHDLLAALSHTDYNSQQNYTDLRTINCQIGKNETHQSGNQTTLRQRQGESEQQSRDLSIDFSNHTNLQTNIQTFRDKIDRKMPYDEAKKLRQSKNEVLDYQLRRESLQNICLLSSVSQNNAASGRQGKFKSVEKAQKQFNGAVNSSNTKGQLFAKFDSLQAQYQPMYGQSRNFEGSPERLGKQQSSKTTPTDILSSPQTLKIKPNYFKEDSDKVSDNNNLNRDICTVNSIQNCQVMLNNYSQQPYVDQDYCQLHAENGNDSYVCNNCDVKEQNSQIYGQSQGQKVLKKDKTYKTIQLFKQNSERQIKQSIYTRDGIIDTPQSKDPKRTKNCAFLLKQQLQNGIIRGNRTLDVRHAAIAEQYGQKKRLINVNLNCQPLKGNYIETKLQATERHFQKCKTQFSIYARQQNQSRLNCQKKPESAQYAQFRLKSGEMLQNKLLGQVNRPGTVETVFHSVNNVTNTTKQNSNKGDHVLSPSPQTSDVLQKSYNFNSSLHNASDINTFHGAQTFYPPKAPVPPNVIPPQNTPDFPITSYQQHTVFNNHKDLPIYKQTADDVMPTVTVGTARNQGMGSSVPVSRSEQDYCEGDGLQGQGKQGRKSERNTTGTVVKSERRVQIPSDQGCQADLVELFSPETDFMKKGKGIRGQDRKMNQNESPDQNDPSNVLFQNQIVVNDSNFDEQPYQNKVFTNDKQQQDEDDDIDNLQQFSAEKYIQQFDFNQMRPSVNTCSLRVDQSKHNIMETNETALGGLQAIANLEQSELECLNEILGSENPDSNLQGYAQNLQQAQHNSRNNQKSVQTSCNFQQPSPPAISRMNEQMLWQIDNLTNEDLRFRKQDDQYQVQISKQRSQMYKDSQYNQFNNGLMINQMACYRPLNAQNQDIKYLILPQQNIIQSQTRVFSDFIAQTESQFQFFNKQQQNMQQMTSNKLKQAHDLLLKNKIDQNQRKVTRIIAKRGQEVEGQLQVKGVEMGVSSQHH